MLRSSWKSIILFFTLSLSACGGGEPRSNSLGANGAEKARAASDSVTVGATWTLENVQVTCALNTCPAQVGVVIFKQLASTSRSAIYRCTAALIDGDKVITSGHCDHSDAATGYFVTRSDFGTRQVQKITKLLYKNFTANVTKPQDLSGRPDVAVFQLENAITGIAPLRLANTPTKNYRQLTGYVVNKGQGEDEFKMTIGKIVCSVRRHGFYFPYEVSESPDVIRAFECAGEVGNSGAPLFAESGPEVAAVLNGFTLRPTSVAFAWEDHGFAEVTNLRCIDYPTKSRVHCVVSSATETHRRTDRDWEQSFQQLSERQILSASSYDTQFSAIPHSLIGANSYEKEFEIYYAPSCRKYDLKQIVFPMEHVKVAPDAWGELQTSSLTIRASTGAAQVRSPDLVTVKVNWSPPFGAYVKKEEDPRVELGNFFSIALPLCPR